MTNPSDQYRLPIETLPFAYGRHRLATQKSGNPADYICTEINAAFEKATGLKRDIIIGRKVTEILPAIETLKLDWDGICSKTTREAESLSFEHYSKSPERWYDVKVYSDEPGYLTTLLVDITAKKIEAASIKKLLTLTENLLDKSAATLNYREIVETLQQLSGAKFAAINTYEENHTKTITRGISGTPSLIEKVSELLGFKIAGQNWDIIPERVRKIKGGKLVRFSSLHETAMGTLNKTTSTMLHKLTGTGDVYVLELAYGGRDTMGDIIFFMPKGKGIHNREIIELYAGQLAAVLGRLRAEEKLLKNEKRLSLAQVNARAGYWEYDIKKEKLYWSRECEALYGLAEGEFEGTFDAFLKQVHPEDKEHVLSENQPLTENRVSTLLEYEHRIIKKDGTVIWVRESADTVFDEKGEAAFVTGFVMDITERKQAEEDIRKSELKYRTLTDNLPGVAYRCQYDGDWTMQYMSAGIDSITGYSSAEFTGNRIRSYESVIHREDKSMVAEEIEKAVNAQSPWEIEYRVLQRDGSVRWVQEKGQAVLSRQGNVEYLDGLILDITERKKAEVALQESEGQLNQFFSQSLTGFFFMMLDEPVAWNETTDKEKALEYIFHHQRMTKVNQAMLDQYGATEETFIGKTPYELFKHDLEHGRYIWRNLFDRGRRHVETNERRMDGTPLIIDGDYICLYDSEGRITGHFGVQVDVTEQKHQAEQIARLVREQDILLNNTDAQIWFLTDVQTYGAVNEARASFFGVSVRDLANKTLWEIIPSKEEALVCIEGNKQVFKDKKPIKTEEYVANSKGEIRLLAISKTPMLDHEGKVKHVVCSAVDITEQKEMEQKLAESEQRFQKMLSLVPDLMSIHDPDMNIVYSNWNGFGNVPEEKRILNTKCYKTYRGLDQTCPDCQAVEVLKTKEAIQKEVELPGGAWVDLRVMPVLGKHGSVELFVEWVRDITEKKEAETALTERLAFEKMISAISSNFVNLPAERLDDGINYALQLTGEFFGVDRSYLFRFSEDLQFMSNTHEWCAEEIEPQSDKINNHPVDSLPWWAERIKRDDHVYIADTEKLPPEAAAEKTEFQGQGIRTLLCVPIKRDSRLHGFFGFDSVKAKRTWTEDQIVLLKVIAELIANALVRHMHEETIHRLSINDQLTGLYNRRYYENELKRLDSSREHPVAVISADLDGLKLINDTLGHSEGDRYLQAGADLLKKSLRTSDILARIGGDEFALLLTRTTKEEAEIIMKRIRSQVEAYNHRQNDLPLSISLGLAVSENPDYSLEETFRAADNIMYTDKLQQGKKARTIIVSSLLASLFRRGNLAEGDREQVQEFSIRLGLALRLEENHMADLSLLAQVYDLGKVALQDKLLHQNILENTGELTEAEREAIYRHPETGYRIALASPDLAGVAELILRHHEKHDGSGYPLGIKGEEIPIECRILAIAIAYSAMTHPRPYAEALSHEEALAELERCAGSQFDPQLVEAFTAMFSAET